MSDDGEVEIDDDGRTERERSSTSEPPDERNAARVNRSDSGRALADELGRIDVRTTPEGHVEGTITDLTEVDDRTVRLDVRLPHDRTTSFDLAKPIPWSREFLLARIVEDLGYRAASIDHVVGESVAVERVDDAEEPASWWSATASELGVALFTRMGERFDLEVTTAAEWRLVDPRDRVAARTRPRLSRTQAAGAATVLLGTMLAAVGAALVAAGGTWLSIAGPAAVSAGILAALPGVLLVGLGIALLVWSA
ncbi:hypothetical protein [Halovivax cerinus]|uniref:Uncharacterized protein n=1 Tax=Halovivax cerinus TaxID=1487865 RepID=A0ABD5NL88_9EURY|nr:hypothetical protein [Halovivax cerinus]